MKDGIDKKRITVTGNTGVDELYHVLERLRDPGGRSEAERNPIRQLTADAWCKITGGGNSAPLILVTGHRRENFGDGLENICRALKWIAEIRPDVSILYCLHPNPNAPARRILGQTDSGGMREEVVHLGKHVLPHEVTARVEAVDAGFVHVIGVDEDAVVREPLTHLKQPTPGRQPAKNAHPSGDRRAAIRIARYLENGNDLDSFP